MKRKRWTDEDKAYLKANYAHKRTTVVARTLKRTPHACMVMAGDLGIKKRNLHAPPCGHGKSTNAKAQW